MRLILSIMGSILIGALLLTACNSAEQKKVAATTAPVNRTQPAAPTVVADGVRRVTPTELRDLIANNEAFVVDVRNAETYNVSHIRGAKLIPEAEVANRSNELPKNKLIVTYCS